MNVEYRTLNVECRTMNRMMKKLLLLFVILNLVQHQSSAQDYIPFPDSGAVWINAHYTLETQPYYHYELYSTTNYCINSEDTIINSTTYKKVNYCEGAYKAAIRDDNGKVYIVPPDSTTEYLLYDFTLEVGDTLGEFYYESPGEWPQLSYNDVYINQVDSVDINGTYHKRIYLEVTVWTEGIGCAQGLFAEPYTNVSGYLGELMCMSQNDTTLYPQVSYTSCLTPIGIEESMNNTITLYPNPATTTLTLQTEHRLPNTDNRLQIYNTQGQLVYHSTFDIERSTPDSYRVDISQFPTGLYYLHLQSGEGVGVKKFEVIR
jgi:hypothetical protein